MLKFFWSNSNRNDFHLHGFSRDKEAHFLQFWLFLPAVFEEISKRHVIDLIVFFYHPWTCSNVGISSIVSFGVGCSVTVSGK